MSDLQRFPGAMASLSEPALSILRKIPFLGEYIRYEEGKERIERAIDEKLVHEYQILNDPIAQIDFLERFNNNQDRKAVLGHILDVQANRQKHINVAQVLGRLYENAKNTEKEEADDRQLEADWWILWLEKAQMTSDPLKQEILARILEAESRRSGTIPPRFVRVLADLANDEIELFARWAPKFTRDGIYIHRLKQFVNVELADIPVLEQRSLREAGLLAAATGIGEELTTTSRKIDKQTCHVLGFRRYALLIWKDQPSMTYSYHSNLTKEGLLLRDLLDLTDVFDFVRDLGQQIKRELTCSVSIHEAQHHTISKHPLLTL